MNIQIFRIMVIIVFLSNFALTPVVWGNGYMPVEEIPRPDRQLLCSAFPNIHHCSEGGSNPSLGIGCEYSCEAEYYVCMNATFGNFDFCALVFQKCIADCNWRFITDIVDIPNSSIENNQSKWICTEFPFLNIRHLYPIQYLTCEMSCENDYNECMDVVYNNDNFCSVILNRCIAHCHRDVIIY